MLVRFTTTTEMLRLVASALHTGPIPRELGDLVALMRLDLSENKLVGECVQISSQPRGIRERLPPELFHGTDWYVEFLRTN